MPVHDEYKVLLQKEETRIKRIDISTSTLRKMSIQKDGCIKTGTMHARGKRKN
jgi:ribosomal protein L28